MFRPAIPGLEGKRLCAPGRVYDGEPCVTQPNRGIKQD